MQHQTCSVAESDGHRRVNNNPLAEMAGLLAQGLLFLFVFAFVFLRAGTAPLRAAESSASLAHGAAAGAAEPRA